MSNSDSLPSSCSGAAQLLNSALFQFNRPFSFYLAPKEPTYSPQRRERDCFSKAKRNASKKWRNSVKKPYETAPENRRNTGDGKSQKEDLGKVNFAIFKKSGVLFLDQCFFGVVGGMYKRKRPQTSKKSKSRGI